ncbi:MAG: hypothetical protein R3C52_05075 [Hyphomonadaceae bacterium]
MKRRIPILAVLALLLAPVAAAQTPPFADNWAGSQKQERSRDDVDLNQVFRELKARYGGKHIGAERRGDKVRIRWDASDGRLLVIEVDARTGNIISVRG